LTLTPHLPQARPARPGRPGPPRSRLHPALSHGLPGQRPLPRSRPGTRADAHPGRLAAP